VILACNTASAKALRTIQQNDLPIIDNTLRVLGVIRPTSEVLGSFTKTGHVGVLGTSGTINSNSYPIEIEKFFPHIKVHQHACPMWVPLVENNEFDKDGADYFIEKDIKELLSQSSEIDTIVLGCTHYPLLIEKIRKHLPPHIKILSQGDIVAHSLEDYLLRHPEIENVCSKNGSCTFLTTDSSGNFDDHAALFFGEPVISSHIHL
jgi:glutamate racemase